MSTRIALLAGTVALLLLVPVPAGADTTDVPSGDTRVAPTRHRAAHRPTDGWYLALVNHGDPRRTGVRVHRQTVELVAPGGRRTPVFAKPADRRTAFRLADWSADGTTALLITQRMRFSEATRLDLATGATVTLRLPAGVAEAALAPDGDGLLAIGYEEHGQAPLTRLAWDGTSSPISPDVDGPLLVTPDGTAVVTHGRSWGLRQLRVVSLADGSVERVIATPHTCSPVRWWDRHTVLATCYVGGGSTLSLVDLRARRSAAVTPLTSRRRVEEGDFGHLDARQAGHHLYLQVAGACGYLYLARGQRDGRVTRVALPDAVGNVVLVDARRQRLTLQHAVGCDGNAPRSALTRYDARRGRERPLVVLPRRAEFGGVLPYGEVRATGR